MIDVLRAATLKMGYIKRVGERLEVTKCGKFVLPDPTQNL
jgi:hypothetical protein